MLDVVVTPVIPVVGRQKQEIQEFEASSFKKQDSVRKEERRKAWKVGRKEGGKEVVEANGKFHIVLPQFMSVYFH
jgi:hypothetical protein